MVKQYDLYGIGAALLDTECRVSDQFLETSGIEKGVMTLVDEKRQSEILISLAASENDFVRKCGGSVCNSIVAAGLLGSDTFFKDGDNFTLGSPVVRSSVLIFVNRCRWCKQ